MLKSEVCENIKFFKWELLCFVHEGSFIWLFYYPA
ncbi:hypothetical protein CLOBOL_05105 [Enterocloster bolteae ATCC BAA-613]|uniref:Uncharacterized protein n=1 Tax=Enterocloster bolteae (strain ATCC BAA-613 / DSM 15670 / CCUG 46953 / JCM 12243 / WAL 16351) TaxID=411902 RepID=A8RYE7_ENTBW|nr:hypothetical protein CLOBOL_05105 [Enterocloster bolteae ATCC BAA-613]